MCDVATESFIESRGVGGGARFHYLTAIAPRPLETRTDIRKLFTDLAARVPGKASLVHLKIFASREGAALSRKAAPSAFTPLVVPTTVVLDEPCIGGDVAGIQLLAVEGMSSSEKVFSGDRPVGHVMEHDEWRLLYLTDVRPVNTNGLEPAAQMAEMFSRAGELVERCDFRFQDVVRTWIYVDELLDAYADLNRTRDDFFRRVGIGPSASSAPPASTGIAGSHPSGVASFMDLVAVAGCGPVEPMRTSHQCEAYDYGSSFSRGTTVELAGHRLLYASGTASIDGAGETVHVGDPRGQIRETYAAVDTLLRHQGAGLDHAVTGVLFFKDPSTYRAWNELRELGELPDLPAIPVFADVCRPELLFELEVTAAM